ncbi:MAG: hypothetical protein ACK4SM_06085 [Aquificaceae bacterium]
MLRDINLVLLTVRLLIALFFILIAFGKPIGTKSSLLVLSTLYISFSMFFYLHPAKGGKVKKFIDVIILPVLCLTSGEVRTVFSLYVPAVFYINRDTVVSLLLFWASTALLLYMGGISDALYIPLLLALFLAPLSPDLVESLRKERYYIKKLRSSYRELTRYIPTLEREKKEKEDLLFILESALKDTSPEEYLKHVKERFSLKKIALVPKKEISHKDSIVDTANSALYVPLFFEKGCAYVVFYMESPFEVYDKDKVRSLEKSAKLLNLYIVGFDDSVKKDTERLAV